MPVLQRLADLPVLLTDGGMATNLFAAGLKLGDAPELWLTQNPDGITQLHRSFVDAGADLILSNSFGGNGRRLALSGLERQVLALNQRAADLARAVADTAGRRILVGGTVGPTGDTVAADGSLTEAAAFEIFRVQIQGLKAGGVDLIWIETLSDAAEMRAAAMAAIDQGLAYTLSASFDTAGSTRTGLSPTAFAAVCASLPVPPSAIGANCGIGAAGVVTSIRELSAVAGPCPLIAKASAGLPEVTNGRLRYPTTPAQMADCATAAVQAGARIIGGCCGTTPAHILAMRRALDQAFSG
jgi:methionine synthase I (cobalamin-dependent)